MEAAMRKISKLLLVLSVFAISGVLIGATQPIQTTTYLGFNPATGADDLPQGIIYQFPDPERFGPGPYALFVWTPGTFEPHWGALSLTFVTQMAQRGFVSASVQYHNKNFLGPCSGFIERAESIYKAARPESALGVLCSIAGVSCSDNGIVTAGLSQGGGIAILAKNYAPDVQAAFAMSISDYNMNGGTLSECLDDPYTAIPPERLTIVNGESDIYFAGQVPLMNVSGYTCPAGTFQCWSPTGSGAGWYIVRDVQVRDGTADHCYQKTGGCAGWFFDPGWHFGSANWSLKPNLDWLSTFGTSRVFAKDVD
jgi:hypothetical protein